VSAFTSGLPGWSRSFARRSTAATCSQKSATPGPRTAIATDPARRAEEPGCRVVVGPLETVGGDFEVLAAQRGRRGVQPFCMDIGRSHARPGLGHGVGVGEQVDKGLKVVEVGAADVGGDDHAGPRGVRPGEAGTAELVMVDAHDAQQTPTPVPGTGTDARDPSWGANGLIAYATTRVGDPTKPGGDTGSALVAVDPDSGVSLTLLAFRGGRPGVPEGAERDAFNRRLLAPRSWVLTRFSVHARASANADAVPVRRRAQSTTSGEAVFKAG